ncbi:MAG TPA: MmgE/PrpD family protein, partial [Burkholderiaceae bacterium]|nr:MmgE/PrpD family protein [Burkholderiaceae bacterium]
VFVEHAIGSLQRPMSEAELEAKFSQLVLPVLGRAKVDALIAACRALAAAPGVQSLVTAARPS